jgi:hypothetical protein
MSHTPENTAEIDLLIAERNSCQAVSESLRIDNATLRTALQAHAEEAAKLMAWLGQAHVLCADLGVAPGHIEDRLFEAIGKANLLIGQRDELLAICKNVVENGIGASDIRAMKAAITSATTN